MRESPGRHGLIAIFLAAAIGLSADVLPVAAGQKFPEPFTSAQVDSLAHAHRGDHAIALLRQTSLDLVYDRGQDCLKGEMTICNDVLVLDNVLLDEACAVWIVDSQMMTLASFKASLVPGAKRRTRSWDRGDLDWSSFTPQGRGIISLDREVSLAAVPGIRVGDRLRTMIRYKFSSHQGILPVQFGGQGTAAVLSRFEITLPRGYELVWESLGDGELRAQLEYTTAEIDGRVRHRWQLVGAPVRSHEARGRSDDPNQITIVPHVTGVDGEIAAATFAVGPDWAAIARGYRARIEDRMVVTPEVAALARELTTGCDSDLARIDAIYTYVQQNTRYLGLYEGLGGVIPAAAATVMSDKYGDCKGLGVLLIALLRAVDLEAWPVLVRTGHLGPMATEVPNPIQFNHFIVWADDGQDGVWLDATLDGCPAGSIYPQDAASPVLSLRPGAEGLSRIPFSAWLPGTLAYTVVGEISSAKMLNLEVSLSADGTTGVVMRGQSLHRSRDELSDMRESLLCPVTVAFVAGEGTVDLSRSSGEGVTWVLDCQGSRPLPGAGGMLFLPRVLPGLSDPGPNRGPDDLPDRREEWRILLPESWTVAADSLLVTTPVVHWNRRVWQEGRVLRLVRTVAWQRESARELRRADVQQLVGETMKQVMADEQNYINITTGDLAAGR